MEPNNIEGRSRGSSFRRRALTLVGASALTLSGVGAAVFGASQAFAAGATTATSSSYAIGSGAVTGLTVSTSNSTASKSAIYTVNFTATDGIAAAGTLNVTFSNAATSAVTATLTDLTTGTSQPVTVTGVAAGTVNALSVATAIKAGDSVSLVIGGATNSATATTAANVTVSTSQDSAPVVSANYTIAAAAVSPIPTTTASTTLANATGVTWTLGSFGVYDSTTTTTTSLAAGATLDLNITGAQLTSSPLTNYVITDTPTTGTATTQSPASITVVSSSEVKLVTSAAITVGDTLTLTASSVNNPAAGSVTPTLGITPATAGDTWIVVAPGGTTAHALAAITIVATLTSVTAASLSPSPTAASTSTVTNTSTYTAGFTATTALATTNTITVQLAPGTTIQTATSSIPVIVTDKTAGTTGSLTTDTPTASTTPASTTNNVLTFTTPIAVAKGDVVSVQIFGVQNPQTTGALSGQVSTSTDSVAVTVSYSLTTPSTTLTKVTVTPGSTVTGQSTTYTITNMQATTALAAGSTISIGDAVSTTGTQFPLSPASYQITDLTNSAASGPAVTVTSDSGYHGVDLTTTNAIALNDLVTITITGVINPTTGGSFQMNIAGLYAATVAVAPAAPPNAASTMASGALVQNGGTIYVIAGGVAFGIPTYSDFTTISAGLGNPTVVQVSTGPSTTGSLASGTLVQVVGSAEIMVVGSNNTAYGFSTPSELSSDGYNSANVVQIPSLGSLTVGTAVAPNAASTMASGSLVQNGGTIYVIAGGVAFGIPTYSDFTSISTALGNPTVVQVSSAPSTTGTMASGTLVQHVGSPQINVVTTTGVQVGFSTASQFVSSGYSPAKVVMIP